MNPTSIEAAQTSDFLETADRIAHRICREAVWAADACTWLEWTAKGNGTREPVFATVSANLYGGTAGISLFLTRYLQLCAGRQIEVVLRGAVAHALAGLSAMPRTQPGFFDGAAGICFAAIEAGVVLEDEQLIEQGIRQLGQRVTPELAPTALDVIDGRAGLIPMLLQIASRFDRDELAASAVRQGEQLIKLADRADDGWSWPTMPQLAERNLTGFAHGTAGIATAFVELYRHTGDERFLIAAREGWRYERTWFQPDENNWPDFRMSEPRDQPPQSRPVRCGIAWCHGAAGIGLSRLRAWELGYHEDALAVEIESALTATRVWLERRQSVTTEFSLCHGMAGNAELFVAAAQILNRPELQEVAADCGRHGIRESRRNGQTWPCGGSRVGETPNLMLGLAGIGLFYLRLHAPRLVESVLLIRSSREDHSAAATPRQ